MRNSTLHIEMSSAVRHSANSRPRPVAPASVPSCLRHDSARGALEDARNLAAFLEEAMDGMAASDPSPSDGFRIGMSLTFRLLQDKLDIALGNLAFPFVEHGADAVLWNPEQRGGGDE